MWAFSLRLKQLLSNKVKSFKITHFIRGEMIGDTFSLKLNINKKAMTLQKAHYSQKLLHQHGPLQALHGLKILWM